MQICSHNSTKLLHFRAQFSNSDESSKTGEDGYPYLSHNTFRIYQKKNAQTSWKCAWDRNRSKTELMPRTNHRSKPINEKKFSLPHNLEFLEQLSLNCSGIKKVSTSSWENYNRNPVDIPSTDSSKTVWMYLQTEIAQKTKKKQKWSHPEKIDQMKLIRIRVLFLIADLLKLVPYLRSSRSSTFHCLALINFLSNSPVSSQKLW